ncbi:MAG: hypothetical protein WC364_05725 [Eubacteriales bacterium]|jgi:hypothetical protein
MLELQSAGLNKDGSVTVTLDGKEIRLVKESDLGAIKAGAVKAEEALTNLRIELDTANTELDKARQDILKEQAAREKVESAVAENSSLKATVADLMSKVAGHEKTSGEVKDKLTGRLRTILATQHRVDAEKIKDMSLEDLERTEAALGLVGNKSTAANYDGKGGGSGSSSTLEGKSPLALATMGYEQSKSK